MKYRYIVVEGAIGSGKSTLARLLAAHYDGDLIMEDPNANPFLPDFYRDMKRYALATQMFFLFQRVNQLSALAQPELFARKTIADYMLAKDALFAKLTLDDNEFTLYQQLYNHLKPQVPTPDLVIYLETSVEQLLARIAKRGRPMERNISEEYLLKLTDAYTRHFYEYADSPLLIINSDRFNFAANKDDFELLIKQVESIRGGKEYFNAA